MEAIPESRLDARTFIRWSPIIGGAFAAAAVSFVLLSFGSAIGLSVASASPTWRDTSAALALLSGLFLILQAIFSFGLGGYLAGRTRTRGPGETADLERSDGVHGLLSWALAVLIGAFLVAVASGLASGRTAPASPQLSSAEPLLSYEIDRLLRSSRRPANADLTGIRAEAGRILMTAASRTGVTGEDRTALLQIVAAVTGAPGPEAERRVDDTVTRAGLAIRKARQTAVILSFSAAAAILIGAAVAWAAAVAGGRHRDGEPLPLWMKHGDRLTQRRRTVRSTAEPIAPTPGPLPG